MDPFEVFSQITMLIVITLSVLRTFEFMRIIKMYSPIVTMLLQVFLELQYFLVFFAIVLFFCSMPFGILGVDNEVFNSQRAALRVVDPLWDLGYEYRQIGLFFGNFVSTLRMAFGDFEMIDRTHDMDEFNNWVFWVSWLVVTTITGIILLNFVISEACAAYEHINQNLN